MVVEVVDVLVVVELKSVEVIDVLDWPVVVKKVEVNVLRVIVLANDVTVCVTAETVWVVFAGFERVCVVEVENVAGGAIEFGMVEVVWVSARVVTVAVDGWTATVVRAVEAMIVLVWVGTAPAVMTSVSNRVTVAVTTVAGAFVTTVDVPPSVSTVLTTVTAGAVEVVTVLAKHSAFLPHLTLNAASFAASAMSAPLLKTTNVPTSRPATKIGVQRRRIVIIGKTSYVVPSAEWLGRACRGGRLPGSRKLQGTACVAH